MTDKERLKKVLKVIKEHCDWCIQQMGDKPCDFDKCHFYPYRKGKFTEKRNIILLAPTK
jgi:hypothetical protein